MADEEQPGPDWFWEGNIQEAVLDYMQNQEGCTVLSPGQLAATEQGVDIVAELRARDRLVHRLVSVRGWPSTHYPRGAQAGQPRAARPEVIARGWIAQALLDLALGRGADPEVDLSLALPAMASYIRYIQRLRWFLAAARVTVYLVAQDGRVTVTPPGAPPVSVFGPSAPEPPVMGKRRKLGLPGASRLQVPLLHALIAAGGTASRTDMILAVARWFPEVPNPPPAEFAQRISVAQRTLQVEGLSELEGRGLWRITDAGRTLHDAQWNEWLRKRSPDT